MDKSSLWGSLLCPETLSSTIRSNLNSNVTSREEIKELLTTSSELPVAEAPTLFREKIFSRVQHCFDIIFQDFLKRKEEVLRLNKARKVQIDEIFKEQGAVSIEQSFSAKIGTPAHNALSFFAYQMAAFHLVQLLLLKRWKDLGLLENSDPLAHTPNWQINNFLKSICSGLQSQSNHFTFAKQNVYSWFSPSPDALKRIFLCLQEENFLSLEDDFPSRALKHLFTSSTLSRPLAQDHSPSTTDMLFKILFSVRCNDSGISLQEYALDGEAKEQILVSGLANGNSLISLKKYYRNGEMSGVWAFSNCDFEKFLSEALVLWNPSKRFSLFHLLSRAALKQKGQVDSLFQQKIQIPYQAGFALCLPETDGSDLSDASILLSHLKEGGLFLLGSNQFWPMDTTPQAQALRENTLRHSNVRLMIDLRQLTCSTGDALPKGIFLFERCNSKEIRDSNRPKIIRVKGQLSSENSKTFAEYLLASLQSSLSPGELVTSQVPGISDTIKVECMTAAANQQQLKSTPWITLTDPKFYEFSKKLKRFLNRAYLMSTFLKWSSQKDLRIPKRGILLQENSQRTLEAFSEQCTQPQNVSAGAYLFLPESSVVEHADFFVAQMHSAPLQFWYRLEIEQNENSRSHKAIERQHEQRLKMLPIVRLFDPGTLLPASNSSIASFHLEQAKEEINRLLRGQNMSLAERCKIHEIICHLESTLRSELLFCQEFSKHLFPDLEITRMSLPQNLPTPSPSLIMSIFGHLDKTNALQHPSIHITKLKPSNNFKIQNVQLNESSQGAVAELLVFSGIEPFIRLSGPSLFINVIKAEVQKGIGHNWLETMNRVFLPTDLLLVQTQLKEVVSTIEHKLKITRECSNLLDQIFLYLFQLVQDIKDLSARTTIHHHLHPEDSRVSVLYQKLPLPQNFSWQAEDFEVPKGLLQ